MAIYTVHAPPEADSPADAADRLVFIPDGLSLGALLLPLPWLLWNRLWLVAVGYVAVLVGFELAGRHFGELPVGAAAALASLWFAIEAREFRRWTLGRRGWRMLGVVEAGDPGVAEHRFLHALADRRNETPPADAPATPPPPVPRVRPAGGGPVIGLFPEARRMGR